MYSNSMLQKPKSSQRINFLSWKEVEVKDAILLWGNDQVTQFIGGPFTLEQIHERWILECEREIKYGIQYWPLYQRHNEGDSDKDCRILIGCCGLRPYQLNDELTITSESILEFGVHLLPQYWGQGYSIEAANCVIDHAFHVIGVKRLFAGHNPRNSASRLFLQKLGFRYSHDQYYPPTGLNHPSYFLDHS